MPKRASNVVLLLGATSDRGSRSTAEAESRCRKQQELSDPIPRSGRLRSRLGAALTAIGIPGKIAEPLAADVRLIALNAPRAQALHLARARAVKVVGRGPLAA
jgi:hypothetical protein